MPYGTYQNRVTHWVCPICRESRPRDWFTERDGAC